MPHIKFCYFSLLLSRWSLSDVTQIAAMNYAAMNHSKPDCERGCPINAFNFTGPMVAGLNAISRFVTDNSDTLSQANLRYAGHVTIENSWSCLCAILLSLKQ